MKIIRSFAAGIVFVSSLSVAIPRSDAQTCVTVAIGTSDQATLGTSCLAQANLICDSVLSEMALTSETNWVHTDDGALSPCDGGYWPFRLEYSTPDHTIPPDLFSVKYLGPRLGEMNCFRRRANGDFLRAFVCNNGCAYVEDPENPADNCPGTTVGGELASSSSTMNPDNSTTLDITSTQTDGYTHTYAVTTPDGTSVGDIAVVGGRFPKINITASLPAGETKEITMTRGIGNRVCVKDKSLAEFTAGGSSCTGDSIRLKDIADCPSTSQHTVGGDPGDGGDPINGLHEISICKDDTPGSEAVTFNGLLHSAVEIFSGPLDLTDDCAHGEYTLAGVEVSLVDVNCNGLLEKYSCDGGALADIAEGATVFDCGLRIANGTTGNDNGNFKSDDDNNGIAPIPTIFAGGPGIDVVDGSRTDDLLLGGADHDVLDGSQGNDTISSGSADDSVDGEGGSDIVYCGEGNDYCAGKDGNDSISAGPGNDEVKGNSGNDIIDAGPGNDNVYAGSGNDEVNCGDGDDVCRGELGNNIINGGTGADQCTGDRGNDVIDCGPGADFIISRDGDDTITACDGEIDTIDAGSEGLNICTVDNGVDITSHCVTLISCP